MKDGLIVGIKVREGDLRSLLNANLIFIPERSGPPECPTCRFVDVREIRDAAGVHKGEWFRLRGQKYMYFQHESGGLEWADLEAPTGPASSSSRSSGTTRCLRPR